MNINSISQLKTSLRIRIHASVLSVASCAIALLQLSLASTVIAVNTTERWGIFEIELNGPTNGNPFVDVRLSATFDNGFKQVNVPGFYDGDGIYRIRFMPDTQGQWHYETHANVAPLTDNTGEFSVTSPGKGNHGPVRVHNTFHFAYADGTPYVPFGTTIYNWLDTPESVQEETLKTLAAAPFNKARMLVTEQPRAYRNTFPPPLWPFAGTPPHDWDLTRFNPEFFRHYEKRIGQLRDMGIEADLILFNPYGRWGFNSMNPDEDDRYVRYIVARFAAYRNVWWSLANENSFVRTKTDADWNRLGALLRRCDPYHHLRSIHNGPNPYDYNRPWVTHVSFQSRVAVESPGSAGMLRLAYHKPVIYDEVGYEGAGPSRWGTLSGLEMVHRFWCGIIGCTFVTHGDYFNEQGPDAWISFGGAISGQSVPRIAFLKKILERGPREGLDIIDQDYEPDVAGQAGKYYLIYFGKETPTSWVFQLYKRGLSEGMRFKADVIDTWNMTITPAAGEFVTKQKDGYYFVDAEGGSVSLPGKPWIALRIQRVGKKNGEALSEEPGEED